MQYILSTCSTNSANLNPLDPKTPGKYILALYHANTDQYHILLCCSEPSLRTSLLVEYAEYLYSDPSLWQITLEYLGACGAEGRSLVAEVIKRVPVDVGVPVLGAKGTEGGDTSNTEPSTPVKLTRGNGVDTSMAMDERELDPESEAWKKWEAKILKIITVCKDYGLEDVLLSVCKVSIILSE